MALLFLILIILCCVILGLVVLIQNPKGGGLAGNIAGFSNQFMGVKQTTDVLEKGTWIFAALIGLLCLTSSLFMRSGSDDGEFIRNINTNQQTTVPSATPQQQAPAPQQQEIPQAQPVQK
ncbi:MAG: preprotein translocase subunit SecG [Terrimonas sp.]|uniref:preprotein translocase subunit SecG n=1 Tax=Terrimonas sp. TaxID=1914338 RepID=UPI0009261CC3|nr:preprotein translocase subunit SecG [Terrimonas sp.]MBN8789462.1 preprotein translocase subunit SecG [Terrimonas sp.]OJY95759.1 MAG: preprotein translocase subunit SecG [Sphingobacteriales bacterium 40-81]PVD51346.1 preprotein translocase subunit SecG [Terrimonas sp.]